MKVLWINMRILSPYITENYLMNAEDSMVHVRLEVFCRLEVYLVFCHVYYVFFSTMLCIRLDYFIRVAISETYDGRGEVRLSGHTGRVLECMVRVSLVITRYDAGAMSDVVQVSDLARAHS